MTPTFFDYLPFGVWLKPCEARELVAEGREAYEMMELLMRAHPGSRTIN